MPVDSGSGGSERRPGGPPTRPAAGLTPRSQHERRSARPGGNCGDRQDRRGNQRRTARHSMTGQDRCQARELPCAGGRPPGVSLPSRSRPMPALTGSGLAVLPAGTGVVFGLDVPVCRTSSSRRPFLVDDDRDSQTGIDGQGGSQLAQVRWPGTCLSRCWWCACGQAGLAISQTPEPRRRYAAPAPAVARRRPRVHWPGRRRGQRPGVSGCCGAGRCRAAQVLAEIG